MSLFLIGLGCAIVIGAPLAGASQRKLESNRRSRPWRTASVAGFILATLVVSAVNATHTVITSSDTTYNPTPWNGFKVYLSSPRHVDSGDRGECGWEENINGRHWNHYAATQDNGGAGSFYNRGYKVVVSANNRNDGSSTNKNSSNNWGANVHIVTHTNASSGCASSPQYLLVMFRSGNANKHGIANQTSRHSQPNNPWWAEHMGLRRLY